MLATQWGYSSVFLTMLVFLFWCAAIWVFITVFADIFRRKDLSGGAKAAWLILIFFVPFFGAVVYLIARPSVTDVGSMGGAGSYASTNPVPEGREGLHMG